MGRKNYVTGLRAVEQLLASDAADVRRIYAEYRTSNPRVEALIKRAQDAGIDIQSANRGRLGQISGETRHQGIVAEVRRSTQIDEAGLRGLVEECLAAGKLPLLLLLDSIQDPHNLGACLRTANAAGVDAVIVPRHGAARLSPTVSKVAAGAAEQLPLATVTNLGKTLDWIGSYGIKRVGTGDQAEDSLFDVDLAVPLILMMGREHSGLGSAVKKRCDRLVSLPMRGEVSSLNVSVAAGICLYEALRQRAAAAT